MEEREEEEVRESIARGTAFLFDFEERDDARENGEE